MNIWITYLIIAAILLVAELVYFRIADKCNIIDKPNERSSHSTIVLRGGGRCKEDDVREQIHSHSMADHFRIIAIRTLQPTLQEGRVIHMEKVQFIQKALFDKTDWLYFYRGISIDQEHGLVSIL